MSNLRPFRLCTIPQPPATPYPPLPLSHTKTHPPEGWLWSLHPPAMSPIPRPIRRNDVDDRRWFLGKTLRIPNKWVECDPRRNRLSSTTSSRRCRCDDPVLRSQRAGSPNQPWTCARKKERKKEKKYSFYLDLHVVFADGKKMSCARKVRKPRARFTQILQICNIAARDRPNTLSIAVHQNLITIAKLLPPCVIYMHFLNFPKKTFICCCCYLRLFLQ